MELYENKINEFIDWITGNDIITGRNKTDNQQPSGKVIRELLQERLRTPIYVAADTTDSYYRIFSSRTAYEMWKEDKVGLKNLEIVKFPRQSEYDVIITGLGENLRYISSNGRLQAGSVLNFTWEIQKGNTPQTDNIRITFEIENTTTKKKTVFTNMYTNAQRVISIDLWEYLDKGENNVTLNVVGIGTGAEAGAFVTINMIEFELEAEFDYNAIHTVGSNLMVNSYKVNRNNKQTPVNVFAYIDGAEVYNQPFSKGADVIGTNIVIPNNGLLPSTKAEKVTHNLQMWATTTYGNTTFTSNILYWNFEIANSTDMIVNHFINVHASIDSSEVAALPVSELKLSANQYLPFKLNHGYYTDSVSKDTTIDVEWYWRQGNTDTFIKSTSESKGAAPTNLDIIPDISSTPRNPAYLVCKFYDQKIDDYEELINIEVIIEEGEGFLEAPGYDLKLSAFGRVNGTNEISKTWNYNNVETEFTGIDWDNNKGWYKNSFRTCGVGSYAEVLYSPLVDVSQGKTIEIDFESEKVNNTNDKLIVIGNPTGARIEITPNSAALFNASGTNVIETNFKSNERVHLAFIINKADTSVNNSLIYIVNNGIFERAADGSGQSFSGTGFIKLGDSKSGVKVYSLRVYNYPLTYTSAYENFLYDSEDKLNIRNNNNVLNDNTKLIDYNKCCNMIDTILISGDLTQLLKATTGKDESSTNCEISRVCPYDTSKNFTAKNVRIRKHGQSTLNYPVPSMKFWLNQPGDESKTPELTCASQSELGLAKNRYIMKDGTIPTNKFVLQANYADSSGVHNGTFQRMINKTWYNAKIDNEYKLRTLPQLFTSNTTITHTNVDLHEDLDPTSNSITGKNSENKLWRDYFGSNSFPYDQLKYGPDSFPCVVFYRNTAESGEETFLGQYVFMEDKKSDYLYGERSIYCDKTGKVDLSEDPFVLMVKNTSKGENAIEVPNNPGKKKGLDIDENRIWDNENVLRFEGATINTPFSSFLSWRDGDNVPFDAVVEELDDEGEPTGNNIYRFERDFELVYPDPDDLIGKIDTVENTDTTKFGADSKFLRKVQPFLEFFEWIVSTVNNQEKFEEEAAQHLDLYKLAAYYIFAMRFGLVDSMERNAQYKTYDGVHWHLEPWDMDIALGNMNTGGIAFDPPVDRNTTYKLDTNKYAFSGRTKTNGVITSSNWLWDALENWRYWSTILVPKVAQALYVAGLSYSSMSNMFDKEYQGKWCEILYNESCNYKYVISRGGANSWLNWLQGARTTHRHWWLSTSMNFYDAKWNCGDYNNHFIYMATSHNIREDGGVDYITIKPNASTYITAQQEGQTIPGGNVYCTPSNPAQFDITRLSFDNKVRFNIYGATFFEEIDLSAVAKGMVTCSLLGCWDETLGAPIKVLNIGCPISRNAANEMVGYVNGMESVDIVSIDSNFHDVLSGVQKWNIEGLLPITNLFTDIRQYDKSELTHFYARGSGLGQFYSSESGNNFEILQLPGTNKNNRGEIVSQFATLSLNNTTWKTIEFWDSYIDVTTNLATYEKTGVNLYGTRCNIPLSLKTMELTGSTGRHYNSMRLVLNWIETIQKWLTDEFTNGSNIALGSGKYADCTTIEDAVRLELRERNLKMDGILWDHDSLGEDHELLTYEQLSYIAEFNNGKNKSNELNQVTLAGYIELSSADGELSAEQLTQIKTWFGETVFTRNSSGLIIDQALDYVQINIGNALIEFNPITNKNEIYLEEGSIASLSATRFKLQETGVQTNWYLADPNNPNISSGTTLWSLELRNGEDGEKYLYAKESKNGTDFDVIVGCSIGEQESSVLVHIRAVKYPEDIILGMDDGSNYNRQNRTLRSFHTSYVYWSEGLEAEFYPQFLGESNAKIDDILYTIKNSKDVALINNISYSIFAVDDESLHEISNDQYLRYRQKALHRYGMRLNVSEVPDEMAEYTLTIKIRYASGKNVELTANIIIISDSIPVLPNNGTPLYLCLREKYADCNDGASVPGDGTFYKTELLSLTGTLSFANYPNIEILTTEYLNGGSLLDNGSIMEFLPNITELDLSNCANLRLRNYNIDAAEPKYNLTFNNAKSLQTLILTGCSNLGKDLDGNIEMLKTTQVLRNYQIDLSKCTNIVAVYAQGTYVDILLPTSSNITMYKLGYPKNITLNNQNKLDATNVTITSNENLVSINLTTDDLTKVGLFSTLSNILMSN